MNYLIQYKLIKKRLAELNNNSADEQTTQEIANLLRYLDTIWRKIPKDVWDNAKKAINNEPQKETKNP